MVLGLRALMVGQRNCSPQMSLGLRRRTRASRGTQNQPYCLLSFASDRIVATAYDQRNLARCFAKRPTQMDVSGCVRRADPLISPESGRETSWTQWTAPPAYHSQRHTSVSVRRTRCLSRKPARSARLTLPLTVPKRNATASVHHSWNQKARFTRKLGKTLDCSKSPISLVPSE